MCSYLVTLVYMLNGIGSTMGVHVFADSEYHACQKAQANHPGMLALIAKLA